METLKDCHDALKCHHAERVFFRSFSLSILHVKKEVIWPNLQTSRKRHGRKRSTPTQAEIAERVGVSRVTVNNWIGKGNWEQLKASITITREEQLKNLYRQLAELNNAIMGKPEGERFPNAAEADTISKLSNAIKKLETEVGLADIISVFSDLLKWVRTYDSTQAKEITPLLDAFVKSKLS